MVSITKVVWMVSITKVVYSSMNGKEKDSRVWMYGGVYGPWST